MWADGGIGAVGSATYACEEYSPGEVYGPITVTSVGYGTSLSDIMHFVYADLSGDGQIIAHYVNATNTGFGGIMIRENLSPGSKKVDVRTQNNINIEREVRYTQGGIEVTKQWPRYHKWLRLDRTGDVFNAFTSPTGLDTDWWFLASITVDMNDCILIGVFSEGVNGATPSTATFDYVKVNTGTPVIPPPYGALANADNLPTDAALLDLNVYPNPTSTQEVTVELRGLYEQAAVLSVLNIDGKILQQTKINADEVNNIQTLQLNTLPAGLYFIQLRSAEGATVMKKLVVTE